MREKKSRVNPEIFNDIVPYTLSLSRYFYCAGQQIFVHFFDHPNVVKKSPISQTDFPLIFHTKS